MKFIGICRVSTEEQDKDGKTGLLRQQASIEALAKANKGKLLHVFNIVNVPGNSVADSKEWKNEIIPMINDSDTHIAVDAIDRLVRADNFDFRVYHDIQNTNTLIYTPAKTHDLSDADDSLFAGILALIGGKEKLEIKRRMQAGKETKRRAGCWVNRLDATPMGTKYDRETRTWYQTEDADLIYFAFNSFVTEGHSLSSVAKLLGKTPSGCRKILSNPIYKGVFTINEKRGEPYPTKDGKQPERKRVARDKKEIIRVRVYGEKGQENQIVPDDLWDAAQTKIRNIAERGQKRREKTRPEMWASGYLVSGYEEFRAGGIVKLDINAPQKHIVYGASSGQGRPIRYVCRCKHDSGLLAPKPKCDLGWLNSKYVNQALDVYLYSVTSEKWFLDGVKETIKVPQNSAMSDRKRVQNLINQAASKERRTNDLYIDGRLTKQDYNNRINNIQLEKRRYEKLLSDLGAPVKVPSNSDIAHLKTKWCFNKGWNHKAKSVWLRQYVENIGLCNDGFSWVTIRIKVGDSTVIYGGNGFRSWVDLLGYDIRTIEGRLAIDGLFLASFVAKQLGLSVPTLDYWVRSGKLSAPQSPRWGRKKVWTRYEIEDYKKILPSISDARYKN